ncbi:hypothetical protein C1M56_00865 [Vibrio diazotrophicus]|nr:hypothetical protein C1M56_00865 [Vibrio diazotrophicus]
MAGLVEIAQWEDEIYQLETTDPVEGGADGIDNKQAKQLANRTQFLKSKFDSGETPDPLPQYLTRADFLKHMLFKGMPMSAVGPTPDPDIFLPPGRVELNRAEYQTVFEIVSASDFFTDQAIIDANPRAYAGHWGAGDGATTFTTDDWALMMNIKVAGGYGAAGSTKEDHIQNIIATFSRLVAIQSDGNGNGVYTATGAFGVIDPQEGGIRATAGGLLGDIAQIDGGFDRVFDLSFDASKVARSDTYTDTMGLFLDHYRVIPKGVFSYA